MKLNRRAAVLIAIILALTLLSGCVRMSADIKVKRTGTADISILYAVNTTLGSLSGDDVGLSADDIVSLEQKGFTYTPLADDGSGFTGYTLTKKDVKLKDLIADKQESGMDSLTAGKFVKIDGARAEFGFVPFDEDSFDGMSTILPVIKKYQGYLRMSLELPIKPDSHNAASVSADGKTLTWDLTEFGPGEKAFAVYSIPLLLFTLLWPVAAAVVVVLAAVIVAVKKKKKKKKAQ